MDAAVCSWVLCPVCATSVEIVSQLLKFFSGKVAEKPPATLSLSKQESFWTASIEQMSLIKIS